MSRRSFFILACLLSRAILYLFIQTSGVGLMPDEAQYWTWSLFPDIGYYSKPPGIAWQIAMGTALFGPTPFGVRFIACLLPIASALVVRSIVRQMSDSDGWLAATAFILSPLGMTGALLATTDSAMVFFWLLAAYWYVRLEDRPTRFFAAALCIAVGALWKWMAYSFWLVILVSECKNTCSYLGHLFSVALRSTTGNLLGLPVVSTLRHGAKSGPNKSRYFCIQTLVSKPKRAEIPSFLAAVVLSGVGLVPSLLWNASHDWAGFSHAASTLFAHHTSHAAANPIQFFLAGMALVTPGFFLLALPAFKEPRTKFLTYSVFVIWGGLLLLSLFRKVQGNWAVIAQAVFFPLIGLALCAKPAWQRWPYRLALWLSLVCQLVVLATPYLGPLSCCPFKQGLGCDLANVLLEAGYVPGRDFLFSDRYQTTSQLWFYGPSQAKAYFFNLSGLRHNQFNYWPGMESECLGRRGFFVSSVPIAEKGAPHPSRYRKELLSFFREVSQPQIVTISSAWGIPVRRLMVIPCDGYNGRVPEETRRF